MAEQGAQAGQAAAQPVMEMIAEWGRVYLRITDVWTVRALTIGAFYLANRYLTMRAVRRTVERRDPDNPDQPVDPQVGLEAEVDSLLVPVIFYSELGYQYFTSIQGGPFLKACLQTELDKISYKNPIDVSVEKWELPNLREGGAGSQMEMKGEERVQGWLADVQISEKPQASIPSTAAGDSGIPEDLSSVAVASTVASCEDVEEEAEPSQLQQQPPAEVTLTSQAERYRALILQRSKDSPTAQTQLKSNICLERGAAMLTSGEYQEREGLEHLLEGIMLIEWLTPDILNGVLYDQSMLHLDRPKLNQLISTQLQANPDSTPCLLIQALQLPYGHSRQQAISHVIDVVLQHGETDPIYKYLAHIYCALGYAIWHTTKQPAPALSASCSALMYKSDHLLTLFFTAVRSMDVSVPQAIRQFHHYIHIAPTCHHWVPNAHYHLVILYGQQDPSVHRDRILHHYDMAQHTDKNRLPLTSPVSSELKDPARRVYEQVMPKPSK